jgi:hypothetical protein
MDEPIRLIGYDIRKAPATYQAARWEAHTREMFLIRPQTPCPLSVDKLVWPSRFRMESTPSGPLSTADDIVLIPAAGNRYFELFGLWDDLDEMTSEYRPTTSRDCGIAVGLYLPEYQPDAPHRPQDSWWQAISGCTVRPAHRSGEWERLGYDVANSGFTSALSNFGRSPAERLEAEATWGACLNDFGLLRTATDAVRFCEDSNRLLASDGPFYIFEISLIWGTLQVKAGTREG